jgi:protein-disulfide isomerase
VLGAAARPEQDRRQRRLRLLVRACGIAFVVVVVAVAFARRGGPTLKTGADAQRTVAQVEALLSGIPQSGPRLGAASAPVTLDYYSDLQCPVCATFARSDGFTRLVSRDVRAGKLQVVYLSFKTATRDPQTFAIQQAAALAAGGQNRFWDYAELFYRQQGRENSGYVSVAYLSGLARQVPGLDLARWSADRTNPELARQVSLSGDAARAAHVSATPTLIFRGPRGSERLSEPVPTYAQLQHAMQSVS